MRVAIDARPRLALVLALAGLAAAGIASVHAAGELRASERARAVTAATEDLDVRFRRQVGALEAAADEASKLFSEAAPLPATPGPDLGSKARARFDRGLASAWERIKASLGASKAPVGSRIAIYEEAADATSREPFVLLGWADASGVHRTDLATWAGRLPAALLLAEHTRLASSLDAYGTAWLQAEAGGGVRVHRIDAYTHSEVDPDDADATVEAVRLIDSSAPFVVGERACVRVRCDLDEQGLARTLPEREVPGGASSRGRETSGDALRPSAYAFRFPDASPIARARVFVEGPGTPWLTIALWGAGGVLLVGALAFAGLGRRFGGTAPAPDITAEAAHELKTPLTAMRGQLEVALRRERSPTEYRETIAATLEEVKGLQNLVASVLLLTRGAEGPRAEEPVDVVALVKAEAARLHASHPDRAVALASVSGPRLVIGDPSLLARALGNLLDNAALHSVAGGGIRLRCEASRDEVRVTVDDDGPGIPDDARARMFQRGVQLDEQRPGSGLGLDIVRSLTETYGGSVQALASPLGGARLRLCLPEADAGTP